MMPKGLFISWATPATRRPRAESFSLLEQHLALVPELQLHTAVIEVLTDPGADIGDHRVLAADGERARSFQPEAGCRGAVGARETIGRRDPAGMASVPGLTRQRQAA